MVGDEQPCNSDGSVNTYIHVYIYIYIDVCVLSTHITHTYVHTYIQYVQKYYARLCSLFHTSSYHGQRVCFFCPGSSTLWNLKSYRRCFDRCMMYCNRNSCNVFLALRSCYNPFPQVIWHSGSWGFRSRKSDTVKSLNPQGAYGVHCPSFSWVYGLGLHFQDRKFKV